jgi:hypothetical protein
VAGLAAWIANPACLATATNAAASACLCAIETRPNPAVEPKSNGCAGLFASVMIAWPLYSAHLVS